jgi:hypothetical protein
MKPARTTREPSLDGFSLHAGVRVNANDLLGRERLCRCAVRSPFALHRTSSGEDGRLGYRMKRPRGGSLFLLLTPDELMARLATLVPPPRIHSVRYHGVFAPNCKARKRVVPQPQVAVAPPLPADLLKKVFALDVLACPACGGRLQVIAFIAQALVAKRILDHLGLGASGPPLSRALAPPELFDPGPS